VVTNFEKLSRRAFAPYWWIAGRYLGSKIGQVMVHQRNRSIIALSGFIHLSDTHIDEGKKKTPSKFQFDPETLEE